MYSRNRTPTPEERYRNNLPPLYSGSHFQYARQRESSGIRATDDRAPLQPVSSAQPVPLPEPKTSIESETVSPTAVEKPPELPPPKKTATPLASIAGLGQEELLLIAILLLLCAEHDRAMDIIVILLLLLSVK